MLKIRRSRDRLIFNMGISIPGKDGLYIETGSWSQCLLVWLIGRPIMRSNFSGEFVVMSSPCLCVQTTTLANWQFSVVYVWVDIFHGHSIFSVCDVSFSINQVRETFVIICSECQVEIPSCSCCSIDIYNSDKGNGNRVICCFYIVFKCILYWCCYLMAGGPTSEWHFTPLWLLWNNCP